MPVPRLARQRSTELREMRPYGAERLPELLGVKGVRWLHMPIVDFGSPERRRRGGWEDGSIFGDSCD